MNIDTSKICIIAPHPDDETLGVGGTIAKFAKLGSEISILIMSGHLPPIYPKESFEKTKEEAERAFNYLGVKNFQFAKIPATYIHQKPLSEINGIVQNFLNIYKPNIVFIPFPDRHIDHRVIFDSSVVACRPTHNDFPRIVLSYETLSETHWNVPGIENTFQPDFFVDISNEIDVKINALNIYESQIKSIDSRSTEACSALARFRGSQNGCKYAEAFKVVRIVT